MTRIESRAGFRAARQAGAFDLVIGAQRFRFDETTYRSPKASEREAAERFLNSTVTRLAAHPAPAVVLGGIASIAAGNSALRHRAATLLIRALLSEHPRTYTNSRLAVLVIFLGLMDLRQNRRTDFQRFLLCLAGVQVRDGDAGTPPGLVLTVVKHLLANRDLLDVLTPSTVCAIVGFAGIQDGVAIPAVRLSEMRTADRKGYRDLSWPLALRIALFLAYQPGALANPVRSDLIYATFTTSLAAASRDPGTARPAALDIVRGISPRMVAIAQQVAFEDDAEDFCGNGDDSPYLFRRVQPPTDVDIVMPSDGSEIVGYRRCPSTGLVLAVEADRLTAPLRGSRDRYRWNNEPVRRAHFNDATVSPNGLVLFGEDCVLEFEFANEPNRSGAPTDRYHLGTYPEIVLSGDRSIVLNRFQTVDEERAVLLSGLPNMRSFGHFILNGASKFPVIRDALAEGWSAIVPTARMPFHDAIISYCGLDPAGFVFTGGAHGVRVRRLEVIAEAPMGVWPYNLLSALRDELPRPPRDRGPRRIYLARPEGARRSLANEDALLGLLSEHDFSIVRPEQLPFADQVAALQAADVVVAPHGSALASLVFCHGSKRIVEIETKTSYRSALYNFLGHDAVRIPSRARNKGAPSLEQTEFEADLDVAREAIDWAVGP